MTPTTSHVATDELIETLERLEKGFLLPVSPSWLHDAIRHYARNVEWDIPDDGSALDRYAGSDVATVLNHLPALMSALKENKRLREALVETQANLELVEQVPLKDPDYGAEVEALGERIGYGALMTSASASWHARLKREGWPTGGAFVAGPCHGTVLRNLEIVRAALQPQGEK